MCHIFKVALTTDTDVVWMDTQLLDKVLKQLGWYNLPTIIQGKNTSGEDVSEANNGSNVSYSPSLQFAHGHTHTCKCWHAQTHTCTHACTHTQT